MPGSNAPGCPSMPSMPGMPGGMPGMPGMPGMMPGNLKSKAKRTHEDGLLLKNHGLAGKIMVSYMSMGCFQHVLHIFLG